MKKKMPKYITDNLDILPDENSDEENYSEKKFWWRNYVEE